MNFNQPARNLLDGPVASAGADGRGLSHVLAAIEALGHRDFLDAGRLFSACAEGRTVDQTLRAIGGIDMDAAKRFVAMREKADRISAELCRQQTRLLASAPPVRVEGDGFLTAKGLSARYRDAKGRRRFERDLQADPQLVVRLGWEVRQQRVRAALNRRLRSLTATVDDVDTTTALKVRQLDQHRNQGLLELEAASGSSRSLVSPVGYTGGLRDLDASLGAAPRITQQVDDSRAATPTSGGTDGDVHSAISILTRHLHWLVDGLFASICDPADRVHAFRRTVGGRR